MREILFFTISLILTFSGCTQNVELKLQTDSLKKDNTMKYNILTQQEEHVIINKGTERPFTGEYYKNTDKGTYVCKRCDAPLYKSSDKFDSECGWPSFDDEIPGAVKRIRDADGLRTEIVCAACDAHLGHVFTGEQLTEKNTRHCVNSISIKFIHDNMKKEQKTETAIFASGCFWGTEYQMKKLPGVISTSAGYTGGHIENPTYEQVCTGKTGHAEAVEVIFDPAKVTYEDVAKRYFETHDPTQTDGQGPDIGNQYLSYIFYTDEAQKETSEKLIKILESKGFKIATKLRKAEKFWKAEEYHQDYYTNKGTTPYCHVYKKLF
jgi:peptide methionine sulfoxide reductase msrA/msrB